MTNHPNRSKRSPSPGANPSPHAVKRARTSAGLTQREAAALIYCTFRAWQDWEAGLRRMHPAMWELWQLKTRRSA